MTQLYRVLYCSQNYLAGMPETYSNNIVTAQVFQRGQTTRRSSINLSG